MREILISAAPGVAFLLYVIVLRALVAFLEWNAKRRYQKMRRKLERFKDSRYM